MKKLLTFILCAFWALAANAQNIDKEINSLMGKHALFDVTNDYFVMLENYYPESAYRAGLERAIDRLDERNAEADQKRISDVARLRRMVDNVKKKKLTQSEKTDHDILTSVLKYESYLLAKKRYATSPLYYLEAQDAVYDVMLKKTNSIRQFKDVEPRLAQLPKVFTDAVVNVNAMSKQEAALAINKAYHAYITIEDYERFLSKNADDSIDRADLKKIVAVEKQRLREFFNYLKLVEPKTKEVNSTNDFKVRLSTKLHLNYDINVMAQKAQTSLNANALVLRDSLKAINPKKAPEIKDFYALRTKLNNAPKYENLLTTVADEIKAANASMKGFLPAADMRVYVNHMPQYPSLLNPTHLFIPPYGVEHNLVGTLFIYTPPVAKDKAAFVKKNYTLPRIKLLVAESVVPGRQMFYSYSYDTKPIRRVLASDSMVDGWAAYAKHIALASGYLNTDEDRMFLAWDDYVLALKGIVDMKYHTGQLDYDEAELFMVSLGVSEEDAKLFMRQIAFNPGKSIAALMAFEELKTQYAKYADKYGEDFSPASFYHKIFSIGKIPVSALDAELVEEYKKDKHPGLLKF
ncbi:DUF885 family protein [Elusimicrobium posterum]|uniref:DUF885 family protein n=1 Tax=Elusimicrobium posterum TaxID=3116653 RepID=UPI003C73AD0B